MEPIHVNTLYGSNATFLPPKTDRRSDQPSTGIGLPSTRVTNALSALGATLQRDVRARRGSHIKMPLHYHNQIVKEHSANSLPELAKP